MRTGTCFTLHLTIIVTHKDIHTIMLIIITMITVIIRTGMLTAIQTIITLTIHMSRLNKSHGEVYSHSAFQAD